jgi:hypothetical protein
LGLPKKDVEGVARPLIVFMRTIDATPPLSTVSTLEISSQGETTHMAARIKMNPTVQRSLPFIFVCRNINTGRTANMTSV